MEEKRLIDANAISEEICSLTMTITGLRCGKDVLNEFMKEYRRSVLRIVDDAPTVDAVEVTRCRECKRSSYDEIFGNRWCNSHSGCRKVKDNDFCSYGDRKDGDGNGGF